MDCECAIIGAGPGGLYCGIYMGRFSRETIIFDGGKPRASWIPTSYNLPGFPDGIAGIELLKLLRLQAEKYHIRVVKEEVRSVEGSDGNFKVKTARGEYSARKVVFATGVEDIPPNVPEAQRYKGRTIRHCPVCDAYEARGNKLVVFGAGNEAARKAIWLSHYTDDITICTTGLGGLDEMAKTYRMRLADLGIRVLEQRVVSIEEQRKMLGTITLEDGSRIENVYMGYSAMGLKPNSGIAGAMGVALSGEGFIKVDIHQRTNVPGVYALGDVVADQIAQIAVAFGGAATAACHMHNKLLVDSG